MAQTCSIDETDLLLLTLLSPSDLPRRKQMWHSPRKPHLNTLRGPLFRFVPVLQYNRHDETFVFRSKLRRLLPHCFLSVLSGTSMRLTDEETHSGPARDRIRECEILVQIQLFSTDYVTNTKGDLSIAHNKPMKLGRFLWHIWEAACCHSDFAPPSNWHGWEGRKIRKYRQRSGTVCKGI